MPGKILCVAEKPSIAKAVAEHLGGGQVTMSNTRTPWIKNYEFQFDFQGAWGTCNVIMTSMAGHLTELEFPPQYKDWNDPGPHALFGAPVQVAISEDKKPISDNIERHARNAKALFIWTDCDREGEHIGAEVRGVATRVKPNIEVKRAKFSNIEKRHVIQAARRPVLMDDRQVAAVNARIELDLRIGFAFTRMQTRSLQILGSVFDRKVISYGSCQFPTLGFVVDRYWRVRNFVPEPFWSIKITGKWDDIVVTFLWKRNRLFDRATVTILYERCLDTQEAKITKVHTKNTKKWKPLPLTTVELQKMASRFLRMNSQVAMSAAEQLYQKGFISYPRTETDRFDKGMDLKALVSKQVQSNNWGPYAQGLLDGAFVQPRNGSHDDKAHPPIHPVTFVAPHALTDDNMKRVYEFVVRRFLACCSDDALGQATDVDTQYGDEEFHAHGLVVLERNYLDIYPYDKWASSQVLPEFAVGQTFIPTEAMMTEGKTTAPGYLTEPDLLALMDANGIGTDATMAEHIAKIIDREYVFTRARGGAGGGGDEPAARGGRGGRGGRGDRGRGRGRGRGGAALSANTRQGIEEFIPTTLGIGLVEGYDSMGFETSLSKPFLRKEMELMMRAICEGRKTKDEVVQESVGQYKRVFELTMDKIEMLKSSVRRYVIDGAVDRRAGP